MQFGTASTGFSRDMTAADLSSHLGPVKASGGLNVQFFYTKVRLKTVDATRNGKVETRLCIAKQPKGDRFTTAVQFISEKQASEQFPSEFAMFKQYDEVPTSGTPLAELPGMSQSQIGMFLINGIRSVEDLVEVSEDIVAQLGIDASKAQKLAKRWHANATGNAEEVKAAEVAAAAEAERKAMQDRFARMEEHNKRLEMQLEAMRANGNAGAAASAPQGAVAATGMEPTPAGNDLPYDLSEMDDDDVFGGGSATATGNDDLNDGEIDPLGE